MIQEREVTVSKEVFDFLDNNREIMVEFLSHLPEITIMIHEGEDDTYTMDILNSDDNL